MMNTNRTNQRAARSGAHDRPLTTSRPMPVRRAHATRYYFAVTGMSCGKCSKKILEVLRNQVPGLATPPITGIASPTLDYGIATASFELQPGYDLTRTLNRIHATFKELNKSFKLRLLDTPDTSNVLSVYQTEMRHYAQKTLVSMVVALLLYVLLPFVPSPLTLVGQGIGVLLGALHLGLMYYTGREYYGPALRNFFRFNWDMNTLILLGTGSAWLYSMAIALIPFYFPIAALHYEFMAINMVIGILNFGKALQMRTRIEILAHLRPATEQLNQLQPQISTRVRYHVSLARPNPRTASGKRCYYLKLPPTALAKTEQFDPSTCTQPYVYVVIDGTEQVPFDNIKRGDILEVRKNEVLSVDGTVLNMSTRFLLCQQHLTGESHPKEIGYGHSAFSGSKHSGLLIPSAMHPRAEPEIDRVRDKHSLYIRAISDGTNSRLQNMLRNLARSRESRSPIASMIDRLARWFVPLISIIALCAGLVWGVWGPAPKVANVFSVVSSIFLCACPCALCMAIPFATWMGLRKLIAQRIFLTDADHIRAAANVTTVVFDKTGTLTKLTLSPEQSYWASHLTEAQQQRLHAYAVRLETHVPDHPISRAFTHNRTTVNTLRPMKLLEKHNYGLKGRVDDHIILLGNEAYFHEEGIDLESPHLYHFHKKYMEMSMAGDTPILMACDGVCVGIFCLNNALRADCRRAIQCLRQQGLDVYMLTGDNQDTARSVGQQIGINHRFIEAQYTHKRVFIRALQAHGRSIMYVGDGINDLEALKQSDIGIAIERWTQATPIADGILQGDSLMEVPKLIEIARQTMRNVHRNLYWTGLYNVLSLSTASGLLYPICGILLNPVIASMVMVFSSLSVVFNALYLSSAIDKSLEQLTNPAPQRPPLPTSELHLPHPFQRHPSPSVLPHYRRSHQNLPHPPSPPQPLAESREPHEPHESQQSLLNRRGL